MAGKTSKGGKPYRSASKKLYPKRFKLDAEKNFN